MPDGQGEDHQLTIAMGPAPAFGGTMAVERPVLTLRVSPERLQGFGLEAADVKLEGADGAGEASLSVSQGRLEASNLASGGTTTLRSSGVGEGTITASLSGYQEARATVTYVLPIAFFLAALVGGLFGAGIQWTALGGGKKEGANLGLSMGTGALVGLLLAVAWALGVNVVGLSLASGFNEAAVFLIAAVGVAAGQGPLMRLLGRAG